MSSRCLQLQPWRPMHAVYVLLGTSVLLITLFNWVHLRHPPAPYKPDSDDPDFGQFIHIATVTDDQLDFADPSNRVVFVGDIHGMSSSLHKLLDKIEYNPASDLLIHTGDVVSRGPLSGSLSALAFMTKNNISGIRGNHDQKVIEWRAWIDRVLSKEGGAEWLEDREQQHHLESSEVYKDEGAVESDKKKLKWQKIPKGWEINGPQYRVARHMTPSDYDYLRSLPLVLHIPSIHTFVVHAGLVPLDLKVKETSHHQPLGHVPSDHCDDDDDELRTLQELAIVRNIPDNKDPWVITNMRTIKKNNKISRKADYLPWPTLWNSVVSRCAGFDVIDESLSSKFINMNDAHEMPFSTPVGDILKSKKQLPCYPSTVVYGHIAGSGLDIQRWTKGLDTGCVYGRKLTSLIVSPPMSDSSSTRSRYRSKDRKTYARADKDEEEEEGHKRKEEKARTVPFGDLGMAKADIVSVKCPKVELEE